MLRVLVGFVAAATLGLAVLPAGALGGDTVYWTDASSNQLPFAQLGVPGLQMLSTAGVTARNAGGLAVDAAAGRIYWANGTTISFTSLDGSGHAADLSTTGATLTTPSSVAIDPTFSVAGKRIGRIYWANDANGPGDRISFANLDGSGGADLDTTGATLVNPGSIAIDPAHGRIYWTNSSLGIANIAFANLDGSGHGGVLNTSGASVDLPDGLAIDEPAGRIYWTNGSGSRPISFANLDNSGHGGDLTITGATTDTPFGLALDPVAGMIYWADQGLGKLAVARLGDGVGHTLDISTTTLGTVHFPVVLELPRPAGAPAIGGASGPGAALSCSQGAWQPDVVEGFVYRAPQSFSYQWSRNGADIAGATQSSFTPDASGSDYRCRVTATNAAGSASQTSAVVHIGPPTGTGPVTGTSAVLSALTLKPARFSVGGRRGGTRIVLRLDKSASVTLAFDRLVAGRLKGRRCLTTVRKGRRCTLVRRAGRLTVNGHAGSNSVAFAGRINRRPLAPGTYRLTATPAHGKARRARFVVVSAPASKRSR